MDAQTAIVRARTRAGLTQAELARRAGTSQPAIARYESGVVSPSVATLERILRAAGRRLEIATSAAPDVDFDSDLAGLLRAHRAEVRDLAHRCGARNVRIFGSVARGDSTPESDIDLLVDFDVSGGLVPIVELSAELSDLLGVTVDVAPVTLLKQSVRARALAEAVVL